MDIAKLGDEIITERRKQVLKGYNDEHDRRKGSYHVAAEASNRLSALVFRVDRASLRPERHEIVEVITMLASALHTIDYYEDPNNKENN